MNERQPRNKPNKPTPSLEAQDKALRFRAAKVPIAITPEQYGHLHDWDVYIEDLKIEPRSWVERWKRLDKQVILKLDEEHRLKE